LARSMTSRWTTSSRPSRCGRSLAPDDADIEGDDGSPSMSAPTAGEVSGQMYVGSLSLDILLGDVRSLKEKRSVIRPVVAELQRRFAVAAAEVGHQELYRRAVIGVAVVAGDVAHCKEVLDACERLVAGRPEVELLSARQRLSNEEDE
jgi:uncharacterized protein